MKQHVAAIGGVLVSVFAGAAALAQRPPIAPVHPVHDDYFGTTIVDPYRYMENSADPEYQAWMKGQADYARGALDRIPGRAGLLADIEKYVNGAPSIVTSVTRLPNGQYFLLKIPAGQNVAKIYLRQGVTGSDELLMDTDRFTGPHGEAPTISFYAVSFDGRYIVYGISLGGSESATIHILDVQAKKNLAETIDRADYGNIAWRPDNRSFFYVRLQKMEADTPLTDKYQKSRVYSHVLGQPPDADVAVMGFNTSPRVEVAPVDDCYIAIQSGSDYVVGVVEHGVQRELTLYTARLDAVGAPDTPWVKVCDIDDDITDFCMHGDVLDLLSHSDAPRYKMIRTSLSKPDIANAQTILPQTQMVLTSVEAAADGLYLTAIDNGIHKILRMADLPYGTHIAQPVDLPFEGTASIESTDIRQPGALITATGWTKGVRVFEYDPTNAKVIPTDLQPAGPYDNLDELTSEEVQVPSYDGTMVPLSIVYKKGIHFDSLNPTIITAYGGYGVTLDPGFDPTWLAWLERGGIFAIAHVRGGGEKGADWHQGAFKLTKPNVWRDLIACSEYLVKAQYTSPARLATYGGSNGGITIGRAITERPDLFAAAKIRSGVDNILRFEREPNGPDNVQEYGSAGTQEGFEDLFACDAYQHVRDGVAYPAVLLTTGINDPRVEPCESAKFAARLQAATSSGKPVLLTVDYQGGHGIGTTKAQRNDLSADMFAFFFWQLGEAGIEMGK